LSFDFPLAAEILLRGDLDLWAESFC